MNILHGYLETIEAASFRNLNLCAELLSEVLKDNTIRGSKESKHMLNEMLLIWGYFLLPMNLILLQVYLLCGPEGSLLLLIHLPNILIPYGEEHKTILILLK
jgi:hypothetical protein